MANKYSILSQIPTTDFSPTGMGFHNVWDITYKVTDGPAKGTIGRLTVPNDDHNAEYIDRAIQSKLEDLHAIASLGS